MSEGYRNCKPSDVPASVQFGKGERSGKVLVSFGGPGGTEQRWGAPFRCISHTLTGKVQFSRYTVEPDGRNVVSDDHPEAPDGDR